jgi:hypothetical protein
LFHIKPKSFRFERDLGREAGLVVAPGILGEAEERHREGDLLRDPAYREGSGDLVDVLALCRDPGALEPDLRGLFDVEEVGRAQVLVAVGVAGVDARRLDDELDRWTPPACRARPGSFPRNR